MTVAEFAAEFERLTDHLPFPWQGALFNRMVSGAPESWPGQVNVPTGLGKTHVVTVWYLAWRVAQANGGRGWFPRRLVYVVNRRTVVDQTTAEVERLRERLHSDETLAISTLRGQFADNGEWYADPSRPAVICGTVDMIGSRLLFGGYRIGFKSRPLHAGFLGQDALLVHDESHLEPAFQRLIESIQREQLEHERVVELPWPKLRVMALSATARETPGNENPTNNVFRLTEQELQPTADLPDTPSKPVHHVWRRLKAVKQLELHEIEEDKPVDEVVDIAMQHRQSGAAVLVFLRRVDDVAQAAKKLRAALKRAALPQAVQTLTGTMRGWERDALVCSDGVFARFMPSVASLSKAKLTEGTVYLICTSAGEVGVDISADHMVCDLSTFGSMAQRLGRVNRYGDRKDSRVDVVCPRKFGKAENKGKGPSGEMDDRRQKTLALLKKLKGDASPLALSRLDPSERGQAFAPQPAILPATDILFDAWALTTFREELPGRPPIKPYLHGVADWEPPRTEVAWREDVETITGELVEYHGEDWLRELMDDYPLKPHELLSDLSTRVYDALRAIAKRLTAPCPLWIVGERGDVTPTTIQALVQRDKKRVHAQIEYRTLLLPPCAGALSPEGMLDGNEAFQTDHPHGYDIADRWKDEEDQPRRHRHRSENREPEWREENRGMALIRIVELDPHAEEHVAAGPDEADAAESDGGGPGTPSEERGQFWHWYTRPHDAEDATRASTQPVLLRDHTKAVVERARQMLGRLGLPEELKEAILFAARSHDLGKERVLWQRAIGNPEPSRSYAKPGKPPDGPPWRPRHIIDYRHEFGSLLDIQKSHGVELERLSPEMQDVALHLIAAHHGYARPHFPVDATRDPDYPQSAADEEAAEVVRRYARLQRRYGRWGLAYLESLLRAADWAASAAPTINDASQEEVSS